MCPFGLLATQSSTDIRSGTHLLFQLPNLCIQFIPSPNLHLFLKTNILISYFRLFKTYVQLYKTNGTTWTWAITSRGNTDLMNMVTSLVWLKHLKCFYRLALVMNWAILQNCRFVVEGKLSNREVRINSTKPFFVIDDNLCSLSR